MRTLIASALVLLACGCGDGSSRPSGADAPPSIPGGPDPIVLRVARTGGVLTAARYPALDSTLWRSAARLPALGHIVGFGADDGYLAAVDTSGAPVRVDLRLGTVSPVRGDTVRTVSSADGGSIFGLMANGEIARFTPSGSDWRMTPPLPAQALYAQADGSLIVAGARNDRVVVWRVRPPQRTVSDSLSFAVGSTEAAIAQALQRTAGSVGDRVFAGAGDRVLAVRVRDLGQALDVDIGDPVQAIAATPSGDRLFVAVAGEAELRVVDRFQEGVTGTIDLPGAVRALRMDPLGRVLLARGNGDSVFVVSLASDDVIGVVRSEWRGDLPLVLPDAAIAITRGADVVFAHPRTLKDMQVVADGARSFWHTLRWNGFRPRAAGLDQPVQFRTSAPRDSADLLPDSLRAPADSAAMPTDSTSPVTVAAQYTVSFAASLDEAQARALAARIRVDGQTPRITTSEREGKTLYRVVLGPFPTRADADRVGKASGQSYWVFGGVP
ncbi:MAG: SPOR domain-containing protein [Gemmatimonas sp.]|uniref:SPOR domain-containing protein n=1 Tax=Gemmatimonas sp. TaxID=1962908 RepID=UPI00391F47FC